MFSPLAFIAVGVGFFKANPSNLVSQIYKKNQLNPDSGFTLYYMAINAGGLVSMSLTPWIYSHWGWTSAFFLCFIGLSFGALSLIVKRKMISDVGSKPDFERIPLKTVLQIFLLFIALLGSTYWLIKHQTLMLWLLFLGSAGFIAIFVWQAITADTSEKPGMWLFLILFLQAILFFVLYFQIPTSLTLYAIRNVTPELFGMPIQPASFQALTPFWIMTLSPIMAILYQHLASKNKDLSMPAKFALGTFLAGCGFLVLPLGGQFANQYGMVSSNWLVLSYFLQSVGELLISALGLSLAARYVPQRLVGFTMGLWFLGTSIGSKIAGFVAGFADIPKEITHPVKSLPIYNQLFLKIGLVTLIMALIMVAFIPKLKKLAESYRY